MNDRQQLIASTFAAVRRAKDPETMTSAERLDTVAGILAGAVLRLWVKHGGGRKKREISRDSHLEVPPRIGPYAIGPN